MDLKRKSIICECGVQIDTTENPQIAICTECNRRYGRQASTLKLLDAQQENFGGVIIV